MKKLMALALALAMMLTVMSVGVFAAEPTRTATFSDYLENKFVVPEAVGGAGTEGDPYTITLTAKAEPFDAAADAADITTLLAQASGTGSKTRILYGALTINTGSVYPGATYVCKQNRKNGMPTLDKSDYNPISGTTVWPTTFYVYYRENENAAWVGSWPAKPAGGRPSIGAQLKEELKQEVTAADYGKLFKFAPSPHNEYRIFMYTFFNGVPTTSGVTQVGEPFYVKLVYRQEGMTDETSSEPTEAEKAQQAAVSETTTAVSEAVSVLAAAATGDAEAVKELAKTAETVTTATGETLTAPVISIDSTVMPTISWSLGDAMSGQHLLLKVKTADGYVYINTALIPKCGANRIFWPMSYLIQMFGVTK